MKRIAVLLLISVGVSGCLVNAETARLRTKFVTDVTHDMDDAGLEAKKVFMRLLTAEAGEKVTAVRAQYARALLQLSQGGALTPENAAKAGDKYSVERERVNGELLSLANSLTIILRKINSGSRALTTLDEVSAETEKIRRDMWTDILFKDIPMVGVGAFIGKAGGIDPQLLAALNTAIKTFDPTAPDLVIPAPAPAPVATPPVELPAPVAATPK